VAAARRESSRDYRSKPPRTDNLHSHMRLGNAMLGTNVFLN